MKYKIGERVVVAGNKPFPPGSTTRILVYGKYIGRSGEIISAVEYPFGIGYFIRFDGNDTAWVFEDLLEKIDVPVYGSSENHAKVGDPVIIKDTPMARRKFEDWFIGRHGVVVDVLPECPMKYCVKVGNENYILSPEDLVFVKKFVLPEKDSEKWVIMIVNAKGELLPMTHKTPEGNIAMATFPTRVHAEDWMKGEIFANKMNDLTVKYVKIDSELC